MPLLPRLLPLAAVALAAGCRSTGPYGPPQTGCFPGAAVTGGCNVNATRRPSDADALPRVLCGGVAPARTRQAVEAQRSLNRALVVHPSMKAQFYRQALEAARVGMTADSANALHAFLAGQAHAGLGEQDAAAEMWRRAAAQCDGMGAEVLAARRALYGETFRAGMTSFTSGDTAAAMAAWTRAAASWEGSWDAHYNLGVLHAARGRPQDAVRAYTAAVAAADANADTALTARVGAAETRANALVGLLTAGAQLFAAERFADAAGVFRWLTERDPGHRDAWYNQALALYKLERWEELVPVAAKVVEVDPLNYNARILLFNAHKGLAGRGDGAAERQHRLDAVAVLEAAEALPVRLDGMRIANGNGRATFAATVEGAAAREGRPVTLVITFLAPDGPLGSSTVVVAAPARGATAAVEAALDTSIPATAVSYAVR